MSQKMRYEILHRMMVSPLMSYESTLSQKIDLILAIRMVQRSSKSDKISLDFDQLKVSKLSGTKIGNMSQKTRNEILYRMMVSTSQMDFILIGYESALSQKTDLIIAIRMVQKSSKSDRFSLGFDQFKVSTQRPLFPGAPLRSGRWNAGEASKLSQLIDLIIAIRMV